MISSVRTDSGFSSEGSVLLSLDSYCWMDSCRRVRASYLNLYGSDSSASLRFRSSTFLSMHSMIGIEWWRGRELALVHFANLKDGVHGETKREKIMF